MNSRKWQMNSKCYGFGWQNYSNSSYTSSSISSLFLSGLIHRHNETLVIAGEASR